MEPLYTIGYEGTDIDRFIGTLTAAGVKVLADLRALPLSRKKGFSKSALQKRLQREGIEYVHFRDLGDPKNGRVAARQGRYSTFRRIYSRHLRTPEARAALTELSKIAEYAPTCLMCFERDPVVCHRLMVSDIVGESGAVYHLHAEPYVSNVALIARRNPRQGASAA
jgi:uncharacterized protein (DUF488 family)